MIQLGCRRIAADLAARRAPLMSATMLPVPPRSAVRALRIPQAASRVAADLKPHCGRSGVSGAPVNERLILTLAPAWKSVARRAELIGRARRARARRERVRAVVPRAYWARRRRCRGPG